MDTNENAGEGVGEPRKNKPRGRPFTKGGPPGPGRGKVKDKPAIGGQVFADMEKAYTTAESPGDSEMVKKFRRQAHENPDLFLKNYFAAMKHANPAAATGEEVGEVGAKELTVEELAERLLGEWEKCDERGRGG